MKFNQINMRKKSKFGNKITEVDNIKFKSGMESERYKELKLLLSSGSISNLILQPMITLQEKFIDNNGKKHSKISYKADFSYMENGILIIEDFKGFKTAVYQIKKKMLLNKLRTQQDVIFRETFKKN